MAQEFTVTIQESEEFPGFLNLNDASIYCGMHASYVRQLVRSGAFEDKDVQRGAKKRIYISLSACDELKARKEERLEHAVLRAAGITPKYKTTYVPAKLQSIKRVRKLVRESDFDGETKTNVDIVLGELWSAAYAEYEAKKAAAAAEAVE